MSLVIRSLPVCAFIMLASVPAVAGQAAAPTTTAPVPPSAQAPTVDHLTFTRRAEGEMQEWGTKLQAFHEKAKATGETAGTATEARLQEAWGNVKTATHGLQTAGSDTWDSAKHAYEAAANDLANAWQSAQRHL